METQLADQIREKMASLDAFMTKVGGQVDGIDTKLIGIDSELLKVKQIAAGGLRVVGGATVRSRRLAARGNWNLWRDVIFRSTADT